MLHRRFAVITFLLLLLLAHGVLAQDDYADAVRDWMLMGDNEGQREADAVQYHTEGYTQCFNTHPDWCSDLTPGVKVRGGFQKSYLMSPTSASWFSSSVPGCVPYVQALKGADGRIAEFGCIVGGRMNLIWEVLSSTSVRKFYEKMGTSWQTGITWGLEIGQASGGCCPYTFTSKVENYVCSGGNPSGPTSTSSPKGGWFWYLFNITAEPYDARPNSIQQIRDLGLVPASMPDSEVLPAAWTNTFLQQVGRSGQNLYLFVKKDYLDLHCGNTSCANWVETYWYLAATPWFLEFGGCFPPSPCNYDMFGFGLVRWNVQSLSTGLFYREGVQDTWVVETGSGRTFAHRICR